MLKTAAGIAACFGIAVAAGTLAPDASATAATVGFVSGIAINFGHELCKRFHERASAFAEKIWGLDKNEHVERGVRRAQISATQEILRLWRQAIPPFDANNDDGSHPVAKLLADWCEEQGEEKAVEDWANAIRGKNDGRDRAVLRKAFEAAFGAEVDDRVSMADRAKQARELAVHEAFDDAIEGALLHAQEQRAQSIRGSAGLASFREFFVGEPTDGGGWFNLFLVAIGKEFK